MQFTFSIDLQSERKQLFNEWQAMDINKSFKQFAKLKKHQTKIINQYKPIIESIVPNFEHETVYKVLNIDSFFEAKLQVSFISNVPADGYLGRSFNEECEQSYFKLNTWNWDERRQQNKKIIVKEYDYELV
jgi:hypothetical protein